jgi:D-alanine-D-alanine ligase
VLHRADFYDYNAKYLDDDARIEAPAKISERATAAVQEHAVRAYRALDCSGFARVDFFVGEDDTPVINEINTLPGFRPVSMFPTLWRVAGITYRELISRIVDLGLERFARDRARGLRAVQGGAHA